MKTKIPGRSPSRNSFLTGSRRENTRVGKILAGSRGNWDSWRDPREDKDSRWESRRDLWQHFFPDGIPAGKYPGWQDPGGISAGIGILGGIPVKTKIPGGSPGGIYGGIFFLTESRRENTRVGKIPAGSRGNRNSWRDPGEGKDSRWESRRDLWRDFFS